MNTQKSFALSASVAAACLIFASCTASGNTAGTDVTVSETTAAVSETTAGTAASETDTSETAASETDAKPVTDRAGNPIELPDNAEKIISLNPAATQTLIDLGLADKIVAVDEYSMTYADSLAKDIPVYSMYEPDQESIIALDADIVFTSGMVYAGGDNPYINVVNAGVCVADIPSSASIAEIQNDIRFIGECTGTEDEAEKIVLDMQNKVDSIKAIGETIPEDKKKTVMFWLSVPGDDYPTVYSIGKGTFLDEMINDIGAVNAGGTEEGWPAFSEEAAIALDPDIILHSVSYIPDVKAEITSRKGWENVKAVKNGEIYYVDENTSNRPNAHITDAMTEMAKLIYPDEYASLESTAE